jgi:hypothetical protein
MEIYKANVNSGGPGVRVNSIKLNSSNTTTNTFISNNVSYEAGKIIRVEQSSGQTATTAGISKLYVSNLDGSGEKLVRNRQFAVGEMESINDTKISKDGQKIMYSLSKYNAEKTLQTRVLVVDINNPDNFTTIWTDTNPNFGIQLTTLSLDNKFGVYSYYLDNKNTTVVFNLQTNQFKEIPNLAINPFVGGGSVNYSGNELVYADIINQNKDVYKINLDSGEVTKMTNSGKVNGFSIINGSIYIVDDKKVYIYEGGKFIETKIATDGRSFGAFNY